MDSKRRVPLSKSDKFFIAWIIFSTIVGGFIGAVVSYCIWG
jgi:hypothetical protein